MNFKQGLLSVFLVCFVGNHFSVAQGVWEEWGEWTSCTVSCDGGVKVRVRDCNGTDCGSDESQTSVCNTHGCPVDGGWTSYSEWSQCSVECEGGNQTRTRTCTNPTPQNGGADCEGATEEIRACNQQECPIDGGWSEWTEWTYCNTDCFKFRYRTCDNPEPKYGGQNCSGSDVERLECSIIDCPVDGQWSEWYIHYCDSSCHGKKTRECDNPPPLRGGQWCIGPDVEEYGNCTDHFCILDGGWSEWGEWSECSKTCSYGIQTRYRECTNPSPQNGGAPCPKDDRDEMERTCNIQEWCPPPLTHRKKYTPNHNGPSDEQYVLILAIIFGSLGGLTVILLIILGFRRSQLKRMRAKAIEDRENTPLYKEAAEMSIIPVGKRSAAAKLRRDKLKKKLKKKETDDTRPKTFFDTVFQFEEFDNPRPESSLSRPGTAESRPGTVMFDYPASSLDTERVDTPMMMKGLEQIDHQLREMTEKQNAGNKDSKLIMYQQSDKPSSENAAGMTSLEAVLGIKPGTFESVTGQSKRLPPIAPRGLPSLDAAMSTKGIVQSGLPSLKDAMSLKAGDSASYLQVPDTVQTISADIHDKGQGISLHEAMEGGKTTAVKKKGSEPLSREEEVDEIVENFWEVPRESIEIITTLAMGSFGLVMKAKAWDLLSSQGASVVVVKELDSKAAPATRKAFLTELDKLKKLDNHSNVISLLGCCTILDPLYMVLEYAPKGELQNFLRRNRPHTPGAKPPTSKNLLNFAVQVAKGMAFLHKNKIIHGELTTRNVLIGDKMVCKVSNVARVRNVVENVADGRLGLRWMSPESICASVQNAQSDVWSFGVLLWEIVNFGSTPYPQMSEKDIKARLRVGYRMSQPAQCTSDLYNVMRYCWNDIPSKRPPMKALASTIWKMSMEGVDHVNLKEFDPQKCVDMDDLRPHTPGSIHC